MTPDEERSARLQDYSVCFSTPTGKRVLNDLCRAYGDKPSFVSGDPHQTSYNEGRRAVYLAICHLIEAAKREKQQAKAETE